MRISVLAIGLCVGLALTDTAPAQLSVPTVPRPSVPTPQMPSVQPPSMTTPQMPGVPQLPGGTPPSTSPQTSTQTPPAGNQVWVNTASHVYYCPGTQWFGKTQKGTYMTEAAAKAAGNRPDHGKTCF